MTSVAQRVYSRLPLFVRLIGGCPLACCVCLRVVRAVAAVLSVLSVLAVWLCCLSWLCCMCRRRALAFPAANGIYTKLTAQPSYWNSLLDLRVPSGRMLLGGLDPSESTIAANG